MNALNVSVRRRRGPFLAVIFSRSKELSRTGPPEKMVSRDFSQLSIYAREAAMIVDDEGQKAFEATVKKHGCHPRLLKLQKEIFGRYLISPPNRFRPEV